MDDSDKTLLIVVNGILIINVIGLITIAIFKPQVYCSTKVIIVGIVFLSNVFLCSDLRDCIKKNMPISARLMSGIPVAYIGSTVFYLMVLVGPMTFPSI